jgi:hypothetical protein
MSYTLLDNVTLYYLYSAQLRNQTQVARMTTALDLGVLDIEVRKNCYKVQDVDTSTKDVRLSSRRLRLGL